MSQIASIEAAIAAIAAGRMVILVDDEDRENEGDLVVAADLVTAEHLSFMAREARGLACLALSAERADELDLAPMAPMNNAPLGTAFTRSIDHADHRGPTATARAATIRATVDPSVASAAFRVPGHVFPLRARRGGVLVRSGQTEGSVDLARLAGLSAAGVICEVMSADGTMARLPELLAFGERHDVPVVTVADLIRYRLENERLVRPVAEASLPTAYGSFRLVCYENTASGQVHLALVHGDIESDRPTLVRVHRADTVADVFGIDALPTGSRLDWSLRHMAAEGSGVLLYLRPDADDEALDTRVRAYGGIAGSAPAGPPPGVMGFHDFGIGAQILHDLGLHKIRVITSKPRVFKGLSGYALEIVDWVPIAAPATEQEA